MTDKEFDQKLRMALSPDSADEQLKARVRAKMGEPMMKKNGWMKRLATGFAACLALASVVLAGGAAIRSYTLREVSLLHPYGYEDREQAWSKLGYEVRLPEALPGGFAFEEMLIGKDEARSEDNQSLHSYPTLTADYKDASGRSLTLVAAKAADELWGLPEGTAPWQKGTSIDGVLVDVQRIDYLLVPPSYEPTEEEKELEAAGKLAIAYGNDRVENRVLVSATFELEGICYSLVCFDGLDKDGMAEVAKAVIAF